MASPELDQGPNVLFDTISGYRIHNVKNPRLILLWYRLWRGGLSGEAHSVYGKPRNDTQNNSGR